MKAKKRVVPATEARVHLGELLRALAREDVIIEKGGVPVAALIAIHDYERQGAGASPVLREASPGAFEAALDAARRLPVDPVWDEVASNFPRWRREGSRRRRVRL